MITATAIGVIVGFATIRPPWRRYVLPAAIAVHAPLVGLGVGVLAGLARRIRQLRQWRSVAQQDPNALVVVADLVGMGISAGLPAVEALAGAIEHTEGLVRLEAERLVRLARSEGTSSSLEAHVGVLRPLALAIGRAHLTGAAILPAIDSLIDDEMNRIRNDQLVAVRRLPVVLALPLTLLILPGFVVLITAPAVATAIKRLAG